MQDAGLVILQDDERSPKTKLVIPTVKLISFYNEQMPRLVDEVMELLIAHHRLPSLIGRHPPRELVRRTA